MYYVPQKKGKIVSLNVILEKGKRKKKKGKKNKNKGKKDKKERKKRGL